MIFHRPNRRSTSMTRRSAWPGSARPARSDPIAGSAEVCDRRRTNRASAGPYNREACCRACVRAPGHVSSMVTAQPKSALPTHLAMTPLAVMVLTLVVAIGCGTSGGGSTTGGPGGGQAGSVGHGGAAGTTSPPDGDGGVGGVGLTAGMGGVAGALGGAGGSAPVGGSGGRG